MVFNATFNNISVISWQSVLLVEETTDKLYHIMLYWVHLVSVGFELTSLVVLGTDRSIQQPYDHEHDGTLFLDNISVLSN